MNEEDVFCTGASNMRYTGNKCKLGHPSLFAPLNGCARWPQELRPLRSRLPKARVALMSILDNRERTTDEVAHRAGLRCETARRALVKLSAEGIVLRTPPDPHNNARWALARTS